MMTELNFRSADKPLDLGTTIEDDHCIVEIVGGWRLTWIMTQVEWSA